MLIETQGNPRVTVQFDGKPVSSSTTGTDIFRFIRNGLVVLAIIRLVTLMMGWL